jgi:methylated-DNA-[protein]-cysteine S-methyltransferase
MMMKYCTMQSPIGSLLLAGQSDALALIGFPEGKGRVEPGEDWDHDPSAFCAAIRQLEEYFAGKRKTFDLPLAPAGTEFQKQVWEALRGIPYGQTCSYQAIAGTIGRPKAVRAVGAANGKNPLPIIVPCHRVIGADGSLTGFGGGLAAKSYLLNLESGGLFD